MTNALLNSLEYLVYLIIKIVLALLVIVFCCNCLLGIPAFYLAYMAADRYYSDIHPEFAWGFNLGSLALSIIACALPFVVLTVILIIVL